MSPLALMVSCGVALPLLLVMLPKAADGTMNPPPDPSATAVPAVCGDSAISVSLLSRPEMFRVSPVRLSVPALASRVPVLRVPVQDDTMTPLPAIVPALEKPMPVRSTRPDELVVPLCDSVPPATMSTDDGAPATPATARLPLEYRLTRPDGALTVALP